MIWNPWFRTITGLWYTQLLVLFIAPLRRRLFAPFAEALVEDAELERLDHVPYFDTACLASVTRSPTAGMPDRMDPPIKLADIWKRRDRLIEIEGKSGFGKSHAMRATIRHWRKAGHVCAFIAAGREDEAIVPLIARKLALPDGSHGILNSLVHVGALRIVIDGLNEASPTMLVHVTQFLGAVRRGQVFVTTQPITWAARPAMRTYRALPLAADKVQGFLLAQYPNLKDGRMMEEKYRERVDAYVAGLGDTRHDEVLRTPMDLTLVAELISTGIVRPTVQDLRAQAFECAKQYHAELAPGGAFPDEQVQETAVAVLATGQVWQALAALSDDARGALDLK
jgi:hypothetical protein